MTLVTYSDLIDRGGTIYNTKTNIGYANPTALAKDLGIIADNINWAAIKKEATTPTSTVANPLAGLGQGIVNPFQVNVPSTLTTPQVASAITSGGLPTGVQQGIQQASATTSYANLVNQSGTIVNTQTGVGYKDPAQLAQALGIRPDQIDWTKIPTQEKKDEATGVITDMIGSNTSNFQGRLDTSATIQSLQAESSATMKALRDILMQPSPTLDETQTKDKEAAMGVAQKAYTDRLAELNKEELRIKSQWGVGPIWRGRLALFNSEKSLMLEPLQIQVEFLSGQYDKALAHAQQMFENAVNLQENKIAKLSALNAMISGQLSQEEENIWRQYQIDEDNRLNTLKREYDLQDQKVKLAMEGYVFDPTSTMDEIINVISPQAQQRLQAEIDAMNRQGQKDIVAATQQYSDEDFRVEFRQMLKEGVEFADALEDLMTSDVQNKDRGELILREIYGLEIPPRLKNIPSYTPAGITATPATEPKATTTAWKPGVVPKVDWSSLGINPSEIMLDPKTGEAIKKEQWWE